MCVCVCVCVCVVRVHMKSGLKGVKDSIFFRRAHAMQCFMFSRGARVR